MDDDREARASPKEAENGSAVVGSPAIRPIFLGNLTPQYTAEDVTAIFERPILPPDSSFPSFPVERVDLKRGYCFVFLKDVKTQQDKETIERFVSDINGMAVPNATNSLRAEFARGDGRVKRKEDDRRKQIHPSETLFVVNFHEETTKREDLQMLFEPYGELVRIDMKRNYAFVQFRTVDEAKRAKETTNGGKLDQSVLTVEYVARQRGEGGDRRRDGGGGRDGRDRDRDRGRDRYRDDRGRRPPPDYGGYGRRHSPPRDRYDDRRRRSSRSRSRSPPRYRSRSPRRDYYDDDRRSRGRDDRRPMDDRDRRGYDSGGRDRDRDRRSPDGYRGRGRSPDLRGRNPDRDYRGGDRDRGDRGYRD